MRIERPTELHDLLGHIFLCARSRSKYCSGSPRLHEQKKAKRNCANANAICALRMSFSSMATRSKAQRWLKRPRRCFYVLESTSRSLTNDGHRRANSPTAAMGEI